MLGMHGSAFANYAVQESDCLIAVGARFDDRVTGRIDAFSPGSQKIHADIDPSSINKNIAVDLPIVGDAKLTLRALIDAWNADAGQPDAQATNCLGFQQDLTHGAVIKPQHAIRRLHELVRADGREAYITTEVGQHQMWAAQHYKFDEPNHWMTSGGLGTMGYGLPAAMGTQIAHPDALVIDISGEASVLMNIQEMATLAQYRLPVKVFILNNKYMGMVRQWQELLHGSRYSHSYSEALPDFVKLAEAFHGVGMRAETVDQLDDVIRAMLASDQPVIADICVDETENCFPMIPSGAPHNEMLLGPGHDESSSFQSDEGMALV
jgi:acetolactate synthase-1/2/3 large subunit